MNFNVDARTKLALFTKDFSLNAVPSRLMDVKEISSKAFALFESYSKSPETSYLAQYEYYEQLQTPLNQLNTLLNSKKNWWEAFISFWGFISPEEKELQRVISLIKNSYFVSVTKYRDVHYPNFFFRLLHFFGVDFKQVFQSNHYDEYPSQEKLKYLSHHLMGATDLNRYKILQGKAISSAYQHFWNDLNEFLQNGGDLLDQQTKNALETLLRQISNSSHLANEIDSITVMSKLTGNEKNQQEFLADLAYQVERAIFELPVGESLIIPHGYQSDSGGHATVLECKKINERDVIFKIINTGSGETQTESYKTLFLSLLKNSSTRPIKVTSELDMQKIFSNNFIEALLSSVIIHDAQAKERMNAVFVQLYYEGKLHDDEHFLSLQMNGTCSHSSLLEWLKTKVPNSIFLLFNLLTIEKAQARLEGVMQSYGPSIFSEDLSPVLSELHAAGIKTIAEAEGQFMAEKKRIREECKELKTQLSLLLGNKGKSIKPIDNFANYYRKKCAGTKLNTEELDQVTQADPLTSWKSSIGKKGWFSSVFNKKETLEALSERAQKTIIAKKISGHDAFLDAAQSVRKTF